MRLRRLAARGALPCLVVVLGVLASGFRFSISVPTSVGAPEHVVPFSDAAWALAAEPTRINVLDPAYQMRGLSLQAAIGGDLSWPSRFSLVFEDHGPATALGLVIAPPSEEPRAPPVSPRL